jgi:predicted ATPase/DNA-binding CsgD family transcriptional regulator
MVLNEVHPARNRVRYPPLPAQLTRFIGRTSPVEKLAAMLVAGDVRLVTLTGPGGVGKTRLALHTAARLDGWFEGAIGFIPLAAVHDPSLVLPAIIQTLNIDEPAGESTIDEIGRALEDRRSLLILDNLEQIVTVGPHLVELLQRCSGLSILATSRIPLHVTGERVFRVPPLKLPTHMEAQLGQTALDLQDIEAVALLLDRAAGANSPLTISANSISDVIAICQQTDGLPLAIELAAARLRVLTPHQLATRLNAPMHLLGDGPVDQPDRLQSMREAIAWSYQLLTPGQQALFRWLSVFADGFGVAVVEAVAGAIPARTSFAPSPLSDLATFDDASLVQRVADTASESRFAMLETVRAFGLEQLSQVGETAPAQDVLVSWCIDFVESAAAELSGPDHVLWWNRIAQEIGNIRAAFAWIFAQDDARLAVRLGVAMSWFWSAPPFQEEGRRVLRRVLQMPGARDSPAGFAAALGATASLEHWRMDLDRASALLEEQLAIYRELHDRPGIVSALRAMGSVAIDCNDLDAALRLLSEARVLAAQEAPGWDDAAILNLLGIVAYSRGEFASAATLSGEAAMAWAALEDIAHVAAARLNQARAHIELGNLGGATSCVKEVLELVDVDVGDDAMVVQCLELAAALAAHSGNPVDGARLLGAATAMTQRIGHFHRPAFLVFQDRLKQKLQIVLGDNTFDREFTQGTSLSLTNSLDLASNVVACAHHDEPDQEARGPASDQLTPREREVLRLVVDGLSDKEIAVALGIARNTASIHVSRLREKLGVNSRTALAALALRQRLI